MGNCPGCGDRFNTKQGRYSLCYGCTQERKAADLLNGSLVRCVFCGTPHGTAFSTCFTCRKNGHGDLGSDLQVEIMARDGYACRVCGAELAGGETLRVQSLRPGDGRSPWHFATFCLPCSGQPVPEGLYEASVGDYCGHRWGDLTDSEQEKVALEAERLGLPQPGLGAWLMSLAGSCARCHLPTHVYGVGASPVCSLCKGKALTGFEKMVRAPKGSRVEFSGTWIGGGVAEDPMEMLECINDYNEGS